MGGQVALRSSATCEDGQDLSMAGVFKTFYLQSAAQPIEEALTAIYQQAQSQEVREYLELHAKGHSSEKRQPSVRHPSAEMAVILQRLIEPDIAGVIYTDVDDEDILIQYTSGFGEQIVDGVTEGSTLVYSPAQTQVVKSKNTELLRLTGEQIGQLSDLALGIKHTFHNFPQDIEFALADGQIYILQARTLTTEVNGVELEMSREDIVHYTQEQVRQIVAQEKQDLDSQPVILSDSNFSELLPRPKEMDAGVFAYIFTGSEGLPGAIQLGRQEMGYPLGKESVGFMHYIGGKPYFSIARDAHTFYAGFPETREEYNRTLVAEYLFKIDQDPDKGEYPEMGLYLQDPTLDDLVARYGKQKGQEYLQIYQAFKARMARHANKFEREYRQAKPQTDKWIRNINSVDLAKLDASQLANQAYFILEHMRTVSCVHFVKAARLGFYYSQKLQAMLQSLFDMDQDEANAVFVTLSQGLEGSDITRANQLIAKAGDLEQAVAIGRKVVGHFSTEEMLEIRHQRLKDEPQALRNYVEGIYNNQEQYLTSYARQQAKREQEERELLSQLNSQPELQAELQRVMQAAQTYMALRETVKYQFVKEYALLRDRLVEIAKRSGINEHDIFSLKPREIAEFISSPENFRAVIAERQERFDKYSLLDLPPVIRESDIDCLGEIDESLNDNLELFGKLLAQGQVLAQAIIVNIEDFATVEAAREVLLFYREQALPVVLVASQMNLSHDPLIAQAEGLIIENAGLASHGAQRARELGRGAIGGIKTGCLETGQLVRFNPSLKKITKIEDEKGET